MNAKIIATEYFLPASLLTNEELAEQFPEWTAERILTKTGIATRHIAAAGECASDLGVAAARKLFATGVCKPADIDFLLF
jgi:3-oxoacyl-[acyl-carrier-protein] synthase-3